MMSLLIHAKFKIYIYYGNKVVVVFKIILKNKGDSVIQLRDDVGESY